MHDWGIVNFLSEIKTHSDTYYLSKFLEEKGCKSLNDVADVLGKLVRSGVNLGVICVVDTTNDTILVLSDGCRSLYVDLDMSETTVNSFSSLTDYGRDDYFFKWFIVLDFQGNIYNIKYDYINKVTVKDKFKLTTHSQSPIPYANEYEGMDEYYSSKKKEKNLALSNLGDSLNWQDWVEESTTIDWIDPVLVIDSKDLQDYMNQFWETESDLSERKNTWFGQGGVWDTLVSRLCTTANLIAMEMNDLLDDFQYLYPSSDIEYLSEYIETERSNMMTTVLDYNDNFEYDS